MNRQEKNQEIEQLSAKFASTQHAFLVGFQGLTVEEDTLLRVEMRKENIHYKVVKNTLAQRAAKGTALEILGQQFVGPTAVAINADNPVAVAKTLTKFSKNYPKFVFKSGVVDGQLLEARNLENLANIPSREDLISKMMFVLNSGAQGLASVANGVARDLAIVLGQIRDQKE